MTGAEPAGPLDEREREAATALLAYGFPELPDLPQRVARWPLDRTFAVRHHGELAAVILWRVERVHTSAGDLPIALCGPGATRPDLRRRGLLAQTQPRFLRQLREAGSVLAGLETPITRWHRRNGWGLSAAVARYLCPPDALRPVVCPPQGAVQLGGSATELDGLYRAEGRRRFGLLVRDQARWQTLLADPARHRAVWRDPAGTAIGYVLYRHEVPREGAVARLVVDELFARDADAYLGLLGYLAEHPNVAEIRWDAPQDDPLLSVAREPRTLEPRICVDKMLRVLDFERAAALLPAATADVQLAIQLHDPQLPDHEGSWITQVSDEALTVERVRSTRSGPTAQLAAPALAPLLSGYLTGEAALSSGLVTASDQPAADAVRALFPPRRSPYAVEPW